MRYDVVVVGAGAAGSALAARLSEDPGTRVLLLEAGPAFSAERRFPPEILDAGSLRGAVAGHPMNWNYRGTLTANRRSGIARGKCLGGSTAINGGYFIRAHPRDFDDWAGTAGRADSAWSYRNALPVLKALENDHDYGGDIVHGSSGPMPVQRIWKEQPQQRGGTLDAAFLAAARDQGFSAEPDKNAGAAPGVGPLPLNVTQGTRRSTGLQYILPSLSRPNLTVRGDSRVLRIAFRHGRASGVTVASSQGSTAARNAGLIEAGEVVLAAGAIATPQLLMLSGLGDAVRLQEHGIRVVADLPGVGRGLSDHPNVSIPLVQRTGPPDPLAETSFTVGLNFSSRDDDGRGDLELLLTARPLSSLFGTAAEGLDARTYSLMLGLQRTDSRGEMSLVSSDPLSRPRINFHYLEAGNDTERLRDGIRATFALLGTRGLREQLQAVPRLSSHHPNESILENDDRLDVWMGANIDTRFHTCGGARMGPESDLNAVVDHDGRVRGVEGLRVADLSVLPMAPSRGPSNTAVFIGELMARLMR